MGSVLELARRSLFCATALCLAACEEPPRPRGAVGIFYGGQVQELARVDLDPERLPRLGFRLELPEDRGEERRVRWELVRPGPLGRRVTEVGELTAPADLRTLDQALPIEWLASLGTINVRVIVDGQLTLDRAIVVRKP